MTVPGAPAADHNVYPRLLGYVRPYWRVFAAAILAMVATAGTEPVFPAILKRLLDDGFKTDNATTVWAIPLGIVALFVVRSVFVFTSGYLMMWVASRVVMDLRRAMFDKLLLLPTSFALHQSPGQVISKLVYDVSQVSEAATNALISIIRESLTAIALLCYLFYLDWKLTLITLCVAPIIAFFIRSFGKRMRLASQQSMQAMQRTSQVIEETASAHKMVKVYGGQKRQMGLFSAATEAFRRAQMRETVPASATTPVTHIAASIAIAVIAYMALTQTTGSAGQSPGGFVAFITAMLLLIAPLKQLTAVKTYLQRGLAAAENIFAFLDQEAEPDSGTLTPQRVLGEIVFDNVTFKYPGAATPAIQQLSLRLAAGSTTALVGASGGGKSTIANLIPRYYNATEGRILLDGVPLQDFRLEALRQQIAYVSQDVFLFNDTVYANIAFGAGGEVTPEQVEDAARHANAWDFIAQLPQGLKTAIGTNGTLLSGGQRQRIAIARALLKNAPILILDEATSALDNESERKVQEALEHLMRGRTTLVVAHRLSTVKRADQIAVIAEGKVVELGTHDELMAIDCAYSKLASTKLETTSIS
jgi:subfamily B ATP-binding cassette protein MsbA